MAAKLEGQTDIVLAQVPLIDEAFAEMIIELLA
jgi:hypothetical protein